MKKEENQVNQNNENQDQLLEIYKIQTQAAGNISNRRATMTRYYIIVMSALIVGFSTLLENLEKIPKSFLEVIGVEWLTVTVGATGIALSWSWYLSVDYYLRLNSRKYKTLKKLEKKLAYQFYKEEWDYLGKDRSDQTYWQLASNQLSIPILFFIIFTILLWVGVDSLENKDYRLFMVVPFLLFITFLIGAFNQLSIEKNT